MRPVILTWLFLAFAQSAIAAPEQLERVEIALKGCHIAMTLPKGNTRNYATPEETAKSATGGFGVEPLPASWKSNMGEMYFSLNCRDLDDPLASPPSGRFDKDTNKWVKDYTLRNQDIEKMPLEDQLTEREGLATNRFYSIAAVNAKGWAETEDDVTGDENSRLRRMIFCIWNPPKAICGMGKVAYLPNPKDDLTKRALEIIRTIEFLPDVPAAEPAKP